MIDDEADYFSTENTWLSESERRALQQREQQLRSVRHASRKERKITLDFAGRRVTEDVGSVNMYDRNDEVVQSVYYGKTQGAERERGVNFTEEDFGALVNPHIQQEPPQVLYGC